ncbi:MAG: hypothetical protein HY541_09045 [Deltaproteobacteria bacterium]|nr:hypothetical protein [Deltaproteobacteria bacterium]
MKITYLALGVIFWLAFAGCQGGGDVGGTETGTTESGLDTSTIGGKIEATASALVLSVEASDGDASVSPALRAAVDGTSDEWDTYLEDDNVTVLTDVFGSPDDEVAPVTRVRVLLDDFRNTVEGIFSEDPNIDCTGATALNEGDSLEMAFYDPISNGTTDDRYFDCISEQDEEDSHYVTLYGADSSGVVRVASMYDVTGDNIWYPEERGNFLQNLQVVIASYGESEEEGTTVGYLDLQYAQASIYSGLDDDIAAEEDNILFKSRSRITGRVELDADGNPVVGTGDFIVTKYDRGINEDDSIWEITTKTGGRGSFGTGEYSLFTIESDMSSVEDIPGTFCVRMPEDGTELPAYADAANCTALETELAWGEASFPFTLSPDVDATFEDNALFEGDDVELISNTGDNFSIPTYD